MVIKYIFYSRWYITFFSFYFAWIKFKDINDIISRSKIVLFPSVWISKESVVCPGVEFTSLRTTKHVIALVLYFFLRLIKLRFIKTRERKRISIQIKAIFNEVKFQEKQKRAKTRLEILIKQTANECISMINVTFTYTSKIKYCNRLSRCLFNFFFIS